jgi:hypothetical protein
MGTKPNFNLILDHIIARHGYDGGNAKVVFKRLLSEPCPEFIPPDLFRHIRYRAVDITEFGGSNIDSRIEEALLCGREPCVSVHGPLYKLLRIFRNSETTSLADRDAPTTRVEESDTKNFEDAGHEITLAQVLPDGSMRFKNSWGARSGQSGLFSIANSRVLDFTSEHSAACFVDLYVDESNLPGKYKSALQAFQFPSIRSDSAAWFDFYDLNGNGSLDLHEVRGALLYTLPDPSEVDLWLRDVWSMFADRNGEVSRRRFLERDGLCESIILQLRQSDFSSRGRDTPSCLARSFSAEEAERIADEADGGHAAFCGEEKEFPRGGTNQSIPVDEEMQLAIALSTSLADAEAAVKRQADIEEQIRADEKMAKDLQNGLR